MKPMRELELRDYTLPDHFLFFKGSRHERSWAPALDEFRRRAMTREEYELPSRCVDENWHLPEELAVPRKELLRDLASPHLGAPPVDNEPPGPRGDGGGITTPDYGEIAGGGNDTI